LKTFLKNLFVFFVPVVLLLTIMEFYLRDLNTVYAWKYDNFQKVKDSTEMIVLGNSHSLYGINPGKFDIPTFNLAQTNQSLYFDKRLTLLHIKDMPKLKIVIISIDFHTLYFSSQGVRDLWGYYETGINYKNQLDPFGKRFRLQGYTPIVALGMIKKSLKNPADPVDREELATGFSSANKGWCYFEGTDLSAMNAPAYKMRANSFNNVVHNSNERMQNLADLEDFIRRLQAMKIKVVFVTPPVHSDFLALLDPKIQLQNQNDIQYLIQKMKVPYFDYSNFNLQDNFFFNCDHLNRQGANLFSKSLNDSLTLNRILLE
jgi:hypothetical protein